MIVDRARRTVLIRVSRGVDSVARRSAVYDMRFDAILYLFHMQLVNNESIMPFELAHTRTRTGCLQHIRRCTQVRHKCTYYTSLARRLHCQQSSKSKETRRRRPLLPRLSGRGPGPGSHHAIVIICRYTSIRIAFSCSQMRTAPHP